MSAPPASDEIATTDAHVDGISEVAVPADAPPLSPRVMAPSSGFQPINARAVPADGAPPPPSPVTKQREDPPSEEVPPPTVAASPAATDHATTSAAKLEDSSPSQTGTPDMAAGEEISYGTRSRNRTNPRPNYAEDQDDDVNLVSAATTAKKKSSDAAPPAKDPKRAPEPSKFVAINANPVKDAIPGTSTFHSSNPNGSKKRKATTAPTTASSSPANGPANAQPAAAARRQASTSTLVRETNVMTFTKHKNCLNKKGELVADDGTKLCLDDHVYLVCEPPGDPYYLCRIMEFLRGDPENPASPVDSLRVNWYYRPRDVQRFSTDTRLVFGTMHSDVCPITSLRGKCGIKHRSEIDDLDAYRKEPDSFYFVQVFDRFIRRSYECIPVQQIINVPERVKKALDERWKFVVVEIGRVKELTSAAKTCKRCARYCASHDSVDCAICKTSYHMNCVQPPLPKKPSRGFAWACGPCSRASEMQREARDTPTASGEATEAEEEDAADGEERPEISNQSTRAPSPDLDDIMIDEHPATQAEIALANMWPMRYLGIHARVEDALQYDDRAIYPRASSRLGPRHQANVNIWHGRPVELIKSAEVKKRYNKPHWPKKDGKGTKESTPAVDTDREDKAKRPRWVQDEPPGYVARGEDYPNDDPRCTARVMFQMPPENDPPDATGRSRSGSTLVDDYVKRAQQLSRTVGVPPFGTNFLDKALELLNSNHFNADAALKQLPKMDRVKDLHEPVLTKVELARFEEGVALYGSEHRLIRLHMKTNLSHADVVRFYYLWKKTPKGREIWGNYGGRKKRKIESDAGAKLLAEVAHDVDDSAFDNDKARKKNRGFECKFCHAHHSRQWRRAPGVAPGETTPVDKNATKDKKEQRHLLALCLRCAGLWRKYAIKWEDTDEFMKKIALGGAGKTWKRRIDEELLRELAAANESSQADASGDEPAKKKTKGEPAPDGKKKSAPLPREPASPPPPIIPSPPQWRDLPCAVCKEVGDTVSCDHCKLTVHRRCFGLDGTGVKSDGEATWTCEQCLNDRNPTVSTDYSCCLCLTEETDIDLVEPPRVSHKKKNDRDREKERLEKELADEMRANYKAKQLALNRPPAPREPLKRTTGNNWVHVYCAVWTPEIRFSNSRALEVAEGFQSIPPSRFETACRLCKNKDHDNRVRENAGACVSCHQCHTNFHASCAFEAGYQFGFDITPVKGSRKDQITTATMGDESGSVTATIFCKEHVVKTIVHPVHEVADSTGRTALQVFVENYKQADLTLTGTVRKANLAQLTKEKAQQAGHVLPNGTRRDTGANSIAAAVKRGARTSSVADSKQDPGDGNDTLNDSLESDYSERRCAKCDVDVTPRWHLLIVSNDSAGISAVPTQGSTEMPNGTGKLASHPSPTSARNTIHTTGGSGSLPQPMSNGDHPPEVNGKHRSRSPDSRERPSDAKPATGLGISTSEVPSKYLCHQCFLKKKLNPSPRVEEKPRRSSLSTQRHHTLQVVRDRRPSQASSIEQQFRLWDEPPRPSQPPPPSPVYGASGPGPVSGPPPGAVVYNPHPLGPPQMATPVYAQPSYPPQPNGYGPPYGGPPMHERHGSYSYPSPVGPNPPPHYPPHPPHPAPLHIYPPGHGVPNGVPSPHSIPPPMQSPTYPHGAPQPHQQVPLTPTGPAPYHTSPAAPYGWTNGQPPPHPPPPPQHPYPTNSPPTVSSTPHAGPNGTYDNGGASASPNLRNLIH